MAAGIPVITSNLSSLPEVAGAAALLVNPESVDEISTAMMRLVGDPELAKSLSTLGRDRAKIFSWKKTAGETYEAYVNALRAGPHSRK
jgi:glycosyltransferase involved in cell wall biosynthesis